MQATNINISPACAHGRSLNRNENKTGPVQSSQNLSARHSKHKHNSEQYMNTKYTASYLVKQLYRTLPLPAFGTTSVHSSTEGEVVR